MELTRRDAISALVATGIGVGGVGWASDSVAHPTESDANELPDQATDRLVAIAEVVLPTEVTATGEFVEAYVLGRASIHDGYIQSINRALNEVEAFSTREYGASITELSRGDRERMLREMGVARATSDPEGTSLERVRYYVVNELLYSLYTSPVGGRLVGNENPDGYPGGLAAYQRGPR